MSTKNQSSHSLSDPNPELTIKDHPIKILPKKPGQKGYTVMHCLDDACIMVKVNSDDSLLKGLKSDKYTESDASLEAMHRKQTVDPMNEEDPPYFPSGRLFDDYSHPHMGYQEEHGEIDDNDYEDMNERFGTYDEKSESTDSSSSEDECKQFLDPVSFAKDLVKTVVEKSEANAELKIPTEEEPPDTINQNANTDDFFLDYRGSDEFDYVESKKSETKWPTVEDFTVELGAYAIDEYLSYFETEEDWMYVIYFQGEHSNQCSDLYRYQAIYSLPTWKYPVAQATASLFFTIEVCKAKPSNCCVDVSYRYETYRQAHRPGQSDFDEKWLHQVLDSKIKFFQTVTY